MRSLIHADGVAGAGLDAESTIDAAQRVDFISDRIFLRGVIGISAGLDEDALGRAGRGAEKTGRALHRLVTLKRQPVAAAECFRIRRSLVGILDGNRRLQISGQAELMERWHREIAPEAIAR